MEPKSPELGPKTYTLVPKEVDVIRQGLLHIKQSLDNAISTEEYKGKSHEGDKHPYIHTNETTVRELEDRISFINNLLEKIK